MGEDPIPMYDHDQYDCGFHITCDECCREYCLQSVRQGLNLRHRDDGRSELTCVCGHTWVECPMCGGFLHPNGDNPSKKGTPLHEACNERYEKENGAVVWKTVQDVIDGGYEESNIDLDSDVGDE